MSIVCLAGELDLAGVDQVEEVLTSASGAMVVVDLSDLTFIDAHGVSLLLVSRWRIVAEGRACVIRGAKDLVRRVFKILEVDDLLG